VLLKQLAHFNIDADVTDKVDNLVSALRSCDYAMALAVQTVNAFLDSLGDQVHHIQ
jgi:hypothetical protein